ncbi:hypothetical protein ACGFSG_26000 [Streptomyces sp. NPDC048512]|uniref:hypothetical protein n=1 Tax=Streptomyces sp. NPDC048512 TaxID=3365563 RepID=UPI00371CEDED
MLAAGKLTPDAGWDVLRSISQNHQHQAPPRRGTAHRMGTHGRTVHAPAHRAEPPTRPPLPSRTSRTADHLSFARHGVPPMLLQP